MSYLHLVHDSEAIGSTYHPPYINATMAITMFMLDLFTWWYGPGWAGVLTSTKRRLDGLSDMFSIKILLRTLFSPWRRIITYPGAGLEARMRAFGDNLVSRCIGLVVRSTVLLVAALAFIVMLAVGLLEIIVWPLLPLAAVGLIIKGLV